MLSKEFTFLGIGCGLRPQHYKHFAHGRPSAIDWVEVITENFMGMGGTKIGGRPRFVLEKVRSEMPIVLHGVSLSLGSIDPVSPVYLKQLKDLKTDFEPAWISDHLCWTGVNGENLHDLLPLPYTEEALSLVASKVSTVQDVLGAPLVLENVSSYVSFKASEMTESEFLMAVVKKTGCKLLLDINNVYVNSVNRGFDPKVFIKSIDPHSVVQFHLAGHTRQGNLLIDSHSRPVCNSVWELYAFALQHFGPVSTLVEWDEDLPEFEVLAEEVIKARAVLSRARDV